MNYLDNLIIEDPTGTIFFFFILLTLIMLILVGLAFLFDNKKNKDNLRKISMLERAVKDLIEQFRAFELIFSDQKN